MLYAGSLEIVTVTYPGIHQGRRADPLKVPHCMRIEGETPRWSCVLIDPYLRECVDVQLASAPGLGSLRRHASLVLAVAKHVCYWRRGMPVIMGIAFLGMKNQRCSW